MPETCTPESRDWASRPASILIWWGLPLAIGVGSDALDLPLQGAAAVWALVLAWMGTGCVLNGRRCRRLHCMICGPAVLLAAAVAGLIAAGVDLGPQALNYTLWAAFAVTALSFLPELLWRRYA